MTGPPCVRNTCVQKPRDLLLPFAAKCSQFTECLVSVEVDRARGPAVGDRQVVERIENSGEAFGREALDRDAANEQVAEARGIAGPQLPAAQDRIEIGSGRRNVQRDTFAGQGEVQVVHQFIAKVIPAVADR